MKPIVSALIIGSLTFPFNAHAEELPSSSLDTTSPTQNIEQQPLLTTQPTFSTQTNLKEEQPLLLPASAHTPPYLGILLTLPNPNTPPIPVNNTEPPLSSPTFDDANNKDSSLENTTIEQNKEKKSLAQQENIDPYTLEKYYLPHQDYSPTPQKKPSAPTQQSNSTPVVKRYKVLPSSPTVSQNKQQSNRNLLDPRSERRSNRFNIFYDPNSPLKMITFQTFVSINSNAHLMKKVRTLLIKINNALPKANLLMGLYDLNIEKQLYTLSLWNRRAYARAVSSLQTTAPKTTIGIALRNIRPELLNIPAPVALLLISDGFVTNNDNLAFDTKLFYAPDPFAPINIVSFASSKATYANLQRIQYTHKASKIFDGNQLLNNTEYFARFMRMLYVK